MVAARDELTVADSLICEELLK